MIYILGCITALYIVIISFLYVAYNKIKTFNLNNSISSSRFSIIIPFRNEAQNLEALLNSILNINYPTTHFEVILVDDDSDDNSVEVIKFYLEKNSNVAFTISIIKNERKSNSPKKDAIETAISLAKNDWIVTTDTDCIVPNTWLQSLDQFITNTSPKLIVAPVTYSVSNSILDNFQLHDFLSLQTATIGGFGINNPFLCNGANLCYRKSIFKELNGFEGNTNIASGDDLFLMEKIVKTYPNDVRFLKTLDAVVYTKPESSINALFNQRIRWASKTSAYENVFSKVLAFLIFVMNASIVACLLFVILGFLKWEVLLTQFLIKFCIDFLFILRSSAFFRQNSSLVYYPLNSLVYPFFVLIIGLYSTFFKYKWKGRTFNK